MRHKKLRTILTSILLLLLLCIASVLLLNALVQISSVQHYLLGQLSEATGYNHEAGNLKLNLQHGIGFTALGVVAESRGRPKQRIGASRLSVTIDFKELIKGRIAPARIFISRPRIEMAFVKGPEPENVDDGSVFMEMIVAGTSKLRSASIRQGSIRIDGFPFGIEDFDIDIYPHKTNSDRTQVNMQGVVISNGDSTPFIMRGTLTGDKAQGNRLNTEMTLKTGKFPITWIPWPAALSFSQGRGQADIRLKAALKGPLTAEGNIVAEDVCFSFSRKGKTKDYLFDHLQADFTSHYFEKSLEIPSLNLKGPDFSVSSNSRFDFTDKSNPHFTLKIESPFLSLATFKEVFPTPFARPWVEDKIFPEVSGGEARLVHYALNGTRDQLKHLSLPENKDVMSMKIEWKEIDVLRDGGALPFEHVSGELNIEKCALSISVRHAVFGGSTINTAALNMSNLYGPRTYEMSVDGRFDLSDLKHQEAMDVIPSKGRQFLQEFNKLSGKLEGGVRVCFEQGWENLRVIGGTLHASNCAAEHNRLYLPLLLNEMELQIDPAGKNRFQGAGRWGRSEFQVSGSTDSLWKTGKVQVVAKAHVNEIIDRLFQIHDLPLSFKDPIPIKTTVTGEQDTWLFQGQTSLDDVTWKADSASVCLSKKCKKAVFDIKLLPKEKLYINRLNFELGESSFELKGDYDLKDHDMLHVDVSSEKLALEDFGIRLKGGKAPTRGIVSGHVQVRASLKSPSKTSVTGTAAGRDISLDPGWKVSSIHGGHFDLDFSGKDFFIRSLHMGLGRSLVDIHGHLKGWDCLKGEVTANAAYLDISDFIPKEPGPEDRISRPGSFAKNSDIRLIFSAPTGRWKKLSFGPLQAECGFRSGDLHITHAEARTEHGTLSATGLVKGEKGPQRLSFTSDIKMEKQPIEDIANSLGLKKTIEGRLTMKAALSAKGAKIKDLLSGLAGSADFLLEEGRVFKKRGITYKILDFLSFQNIIKDFSKEGYYFENLEASFNIKEGTLETDDFIFKSPAFNATAQGTVCLPTKMLDLKLWVQTLQTMDFVVGNVPIIGYILTEKEKSPKGVIIYPFEIKGQWSDPTIESRVWKNLGNGVINIFKRILLTPGRIYKEITEKTSGLAKMNGSQSEHNIECDNSVKMQ